MDLNTCSAMELLVFITIYIYRQYLVNRSKTTLSKLIFRGEVVCRSRYMLEKLNCGKLKSSLPSWCAANVHVTAIYILLVANLKV